MKSLLTIVCSIILFLILPGCWDKSELTDWVFVQAAAVDLTEEGKMRLTVHFYKPLGGGGQGLEPKKGSSSYYNLSAEAETVYEATRNIVTYMGRKTQWSHMRVLLIGEQTARERNIGEILDFFSRYNEPRGTLSIMVTEGKANAYLEKKPVIEHTNGQEIRKAQETTQKYTAKTIGSMLNDFSIQLKSETGIAMLPYTHFDKINPENSTVSGIAIFQKGKMVSRIQAQESDSLLMLQDKYKSGIIEIPCESSEKEKQKQKQKESFVIHTLTTKVKPQIEDDQLSIHITTKIQGTIGELRCSSVMTVDEENKFEKTIQKTIEQNMRNMLDSLKKKKLDAIGAGDLIYIKNPKLWNSIKNNWGEIFASSLIDIKVDVRIESTGMNVGKPYGQ